MYTSISPKGSHQYERTSTDVWGQLPQTVALNLPLAISDAVICNEDYKIITRTLHRIEQNFCVDHNILFHIFYYGLGASLKLLPAWTTEFGVLNLLFLIYVSVKVSNFTVAYYANDINRIFQKKNYKNLFKKWLLGSCQ